MKKFFHIKSYIHKSNLNNLNIFLLVIYIHPDNNNDVLYIFIVKKKKKIRARSFENWIIDSYIYTYKCRRRFTLAFDEKKQTGI